MVTVVILLDTNVISELMKPNPDPQVEAWATGEPVADFFITTITEAELRYGIALLPKGRRRDKLVAAMEAMLGEDFAERILPFDRSAAAAYAGIAAARRQAGHRIAQFDAQIAAIANSHQAILATCNTEDFQGCGITVIDPWKMRL